MTEQIRKAQHPVVARIAGATSSSAKSIVLSAAQHWPFDRELEEASAKAMSEFAPALGDWTRETWARWRKRSGGEAEPKAKPDLAVKLGAALRRRQFEKADDPPNEAEKSEAENGPSQTEAAQNVFEEGWEQRLLREAPILVKAAPMDNAKRFARDKLWLWSGDNGILGTYHFKGQWYEWNNSYYEVAPANRIEGMIYHYLDAAKERGGDDSTRFRPKPDDATKLFRCLEPCAAIDDREIPPRWFDGREEPSAQHLLAFRNCLVDIRTGETFRCTPELWLQEGVGFDYDPEAKCPRFERFLEELFPGDAEAQMTIEEHLGLGMTRDGRFEKAAMWIGEPRSGRGTLARIQEGLVGPGGHVPLNIHTWNSGENSKQKLIGKRVGIFHDARLKEAKAFGQVSFDPGGIEHKSMQDLLEIIAGDEQSWGRKYIDAWQGKPYLKIIYISNQMPNLNDNALLTRFIFLYFPISFLGKEDEDLKDKLLAELPGIANRCLIAYRRLRERKKFIQPKSGLELLQKLQGKVNPYAAFMKDCWIADPNGEGVDVKKFNATWALWCTDNKRFDLIKTNKSNLIQEINKLPEWKHLKSFKPHGADRRYAVKAKIAE